MTEAEKERKLDLGRVPVPVTTIASIQKQLLPGIPLEVARQIAELKDPKLIQQKILEVNEAARRFLSAATPKEAKPPTTDITDLLDLGKIRAAARERRKDNFNAPEMLDVLKNEDIARAFVNDPQKITDRLERIVRYGAEGSKREKQIKLLVSVLSEDTVGKLFAEHPNSFAQIAMYAKGDTWNVYSSLSEGNLGAMFGKYHEHLSDLSRVARQDTAGAFELLQDDIYGRIFTEQPAMFIGVFKCDPNVRDQILHSVKSGAVRLSSAIVAAISQNDPVAIEIGRVIDDLHEDTPSRLAYLESLTKEEVVGLLCSNPEFFYTSSNHLLFDRLQKDIGENGIAHLRETYGLSDEQLRNFVFRAIAYNRIGDFISKGNHNADLQLTVSTIIGSRQEKTGVYADGFDEKYYYLMANGISTLSKYAPQIKAEVDQRILELNAIENPDFAQTSTLAALTYVQFMLTGDSHGDPLLRKVAGAATFDRKDYRGPDGKVTVIQVFDKEDTETYHWGASISWFKNQFKTEPKKGPHGELIFENSNTRVVLFMGKDEQTNADFTTNWIATHKTGIITFRGHSYSLHANMPPSVFDNREGRYVFIPGSCGSASSVPEYIYSNPNTQMRFFSNTSTGRGNVTNVLVSLLTTQTTPAEFSSILAKGSSHIRAAGGDASQIKAFSNGEAMLYYVMARRDAQTAAISKRKDETPG